MAKEETKKKLEGVGGWLLLWIIILFIGILAGLLLTLSIFANGFGILEIIFSLLILAVTIFMLYLAVLTIKHRKEAIPYTIFFMWLSVALYAINLIGSLFSGLGIIQTLFGLLMAVLWLLYWKKSKRVKNTFIK